MVPLLQEQYIRRSRFVSRAMEFFIKKGTRFLPPVALEPIVKGVANDAQQPGTAVAAPESAQKLEGSQVGFLDDVLRVRLVAREPACQIIRRIHVWHDALLEPCEFVLFFQRRAPRFWAIRYPDWFCADFIPDTDFSPSAGIFGRQFSLRLWNNSEGPTDMRNKIIHNQARCPKCKTASPALLFPTRKIFLRE